jgi:hypothetical protein
MKVEEREIEQVESVQISDESEFGPLLISKLEVNVDMHASSNTKLIILGTRN